MKRPFPSMRTISKKPSKRPKSSFSIPTLSTFSMAILFAVEPTFTKFQKTTVNKVYLRLGVLGTRIVRITCTSTKFTENI
jgi:hypothetical protein